MRLDNAIVRLPFGAEWVGRTVYIKAQGVNIYGGGLQDLSTLPAWPYRVTGAALLSPLPDIPLLTYSYTEGWPALAWAPVLATETGYLRVSARTKLRSKRAMPPMATGFSLITKRSDTMAN